MPHYIYDKDWKEYIDTPTARKINLQHNWGNMGKAIFFDPSKLEKRFEEAGLCLTTEWASLFKKASNSKISENIHLERIAGNKYVKLCEIANIPLADCLKYPEVVKFQPEPVNDDKEDAVVLECFPFADTNGVLPPTNTIKPWNIDMPIVRTVSGICSCNDGRTMLCFEEGDAATTSSVNDTVLEVFFGEDRTKWIGKQIKIKPGTYEASNGEQKKCFDIRPADVYVPIDEVLKSFEDKLPGILKAGFFNVCMSMEEATA